MDNTIIEYPNFGANMITVINLNRKIIAERHSQSS